MNLKTNNFISECFLPYLEVIRNSQIPYGYCYSADATGDIDGDVSDNALRIDPCVIYMLVCTKE